MQEDRLFAAIRSIVRRVLNDSDDVDFRAMYFARVVSYSESGITPSGTVDVAFNDSRLQSITAVPILPPFPGCSYVPTQGSQCLVGWQGGDERFPYAVGWPGQGGVSALGLSASGHVDVVAPTVNLGDTSGAVLSKSAVASALQTFAFACTASTDVTLVNAAKDLNTVLTGLPLAPAGTPLLSTVVTSKTKAS